MTADEEDMMHKLGVVITAQARELRELRREVADWKDRYEFAVQAHEADIKHFNRVYSCTGPQQ